MYCDVTYRPKITGRKGVITTGHYLATMAGTKMFAKGGNAVDAGVAAGFALAVLKPNDNSLGGESPILIYSPHEKKVVAISGQGTAPKKATLDWFKSQNIEKIPGDGYLAATVPGMFGAFCTALMKYGRLTLKDVLEPTIDLTENGFPMYQVLRDVIQKHSKRFLEEWPTTGEVFIPGGVVPEVGQILRQPALAKTLKEIVSVEGDHSHEGREAAIQHAIDYFYKGEIADRILKFTHSFPVKDATGKYHTPLLEKSDFEEYETRVEEPVYADYKNYRVFKCSSWTQGPVFLQQLKLLEGFELNKLKHNSAEYIHVVVECAKLAFADRENYYGDPLFSKVPFDKLLSDEYNNERRKLVNLERANNDILWKTKNVCEADAYSGDTTQLSAADHDGYMISITQSGGWIPTSPVIPDVGFPLGTRAQMFTLIEGHPNCVEPGKRPRTTLTPSLAFKDGKPWMVFGTPGGDTQDQNTLQFFLNLVEFGMDLQEAVEKPNFHTLHLPNSFYPRNAHIGTVSLEKYIDLEEMIKLQEKGHKLHIVRGDTSEVTGVWYNEKNGLIEGCASHKYDGQTYAMGW